MSNVTIKYREEARPIMSVVSSGSEYSINKTTLAASMTCNGAVSFFVNGREAHVMDNQRAIEFFEAALKMTRQG